MYYTKWIKQTPFLIPKYSKTICMQKCRTFYESAYQKVRWYGRLECQSRKPEIVSLSPAVCKNFSFCNSHFFIAWLKASISQYKQNRESTEGCSNNTVREDNNNLKGLVSKSRTYMSKMERDQVSGVLSVPCRPATPVTDAKSKPLFSNCKFSKTWESVMNWWCQIDKSSQIQKEVKSGKGSGIGSVMYE